VQAIARYAIPGCVNAAVGAKKEASGSVGVGDFDRLAAGDDC
jgi:hypothetical protein